MGQPSGEVIARGPWSCARAGVSAKPPPHPALSPRGEEEVVEAQTAASQTKAPPLPSGRGQGEGEAVELLSPQNCPRPVQRLHNPVHRQINRPPGPD